jgi:hypothetical protein
MRSIVLTLFAAAGLLLAAWGLDLHRQDPAECWLRSGGAAHTVRIVRFYANVGAVLPGQPATLCYGVENAKSVRISPLLPGIYPSARHCLEVFPEHTTHYTILAEGYDGAVATRSLTLPVTSRESETEQPLHFARFEK